MPGGPPPPSFAEKISWVREAAGTSLANKDIHINASNFLVTDERQKTLDEVAGRMQLTVNEALQNPAVIVGSPDACVERILELRENFGVNYIVVQQRLMDSIGPVVAKLAGK